ncbi:DUF6468 domain-containing protein [Hyphobacterium marinum]|uniref:DUF6468 domain-containing protein n=1 Tax=Hyphobacterium marinum TaxID=3116574 RepID=A0ABU7LZS0_9PROT|nr:DUF6468 domain-containing protein [Hyphobacterium sp. Y6023]MEE2567056.1 DUF6468 domain-containing protein [Hyphobacterium sp. Y6023]
MTYAGLIFEGAVAVLLLVAAVMMWRVDAKLRALKSGQDGIRQSVIALDEATDRARASLAALQRATRESGDELEDSVREARRLSDELRLLTSGAERRADALASRPARRPVSDVFPEGGRRTVFSDMKDVR